MAEPKKIIVVTSISSEEVAIRIAQELIENFHAACVNIIPKMHSIYRWKGEITDDRESLLIIKSRQDQFESIRTAIDSLSGYECPEVLSFVVDKGSKQYLEWVDLNLDPEKNRKLDKNEMAELDRDLATEMEEL